MQQSINNVEKLELDNTDFAKNASKIYLLPNLLTTGNLFFGFLAIIRCIQAKYTPVEALSKEWCTQAVWCILFAGVCDVLDGCVARLGGKENLFGKEFDSLADIVSFGLAPALLVFFLILSPTDNFPFFRQIGWIIGFLYLLCGGVRLARYNVITHPLNGLKIKKEPNRDFIGLPITAAAATIASLVLALNSLDLRWWAIFLPGLMILIAGLMVSNVPFPSFKNWIHWSTETRMRTFVQIIACCTLIGLLKEFSFAIIFLGYIAYGIYTYFRSC